MPSLSQFSHRNTIMTPTSGARSIAGCLAACRFIHNPIQSSRMVGCLLCWQNYEDEELPGVQLQDEMNDYLAGVIEDKGVKDLRDTREQVRGGRGRTALPGGRVVSAVGSVCIGVSACVRACVCVCV